MSEKGSGHGSEKSNCYLGEIRNFSSVCTQGRYGGEEERPFYSSLTLALNGGEGSNSGPGHFTTEGVAPCSC